MDYEVMIVEWMGKFLPSSVVHLEVSKWTSGQYLGYCRTIVEDDGSYTTKILINRKMYDSIVGNSIAWHEFCHLWDFIDSGSMGHGMKWLKKCFRKPLLFLKVYVLFPVVIYRMVVE